MVFLWSYVFFFFFCSVSVCLLSLKPRAFVQSFFDTCMGSDSHTQLPNNCLCPFLFFVSCFLGHDDDDDDDVAFSEYFVL